MTLRVLHITHSLGFGGVETHLAILAATETRDEHRFCAISTGGDAAAAIASSGQPVEIIGIDPWLHPLGALIALTRHIRSSRPDIVHCHGYEANIWGVIAARLAGVRTVVAEEIGIWDRSWRSRTAIRAAYRFAQRIVATSEAVGRFLRDDGVAPGKIVTLYNPVRFSSSSAAPRQAGEPLRIGCVGRLHHVKNPAGLIRAVSHLADDVGAVEVHFIGDGPQRAELERLAAELGIESSVRLHGYRADPYALLVQCHLYVQPSPAEGFGIAMVEAMGCGLPVICSRHGAAPEIVAPTVHGWLIDDVEPRTIAAAIETALKTEPAQLHAMGKAAKQSVRDRFTPQIYVEALEKFYDRLV